MKPITNLLLSATAAGLLGGAAVVSTHDWWVIVPATLTNFATAIVQHLRGTPIIKRNPNGTPVN